MKAYDHNYSEGINDMHIKTEILIPNIVEILQIPSPCTSGYRKPEPSRRLDKHNYCKRDDIS
jgi:hypothetical protein